MIAPVVESGLVAVPTLRAPAVSTAYESATDMFPEVVAGEKFAAFIFSAVLLPKLPLVLSRVTVPVWLVVMTATPVILPAPVFKVTLLVFTVPPSVSPLRVRALGLEVVVVMFIAEAFDSVAFITTGRADCKLNDWLLGFAAVTVSVLIPVTVPRLKRSILPVEFAANELASILRAGTVFGVAVPPIPFPNPAPVVSVSVRPWTKSVPTAASAITPLPAAVRVTVPLPVGVVIAAPRIIFPLAPVSFSVTPRAVMAPAVLIPLPVVDAVNVPVVLVTIALPITRLPEPVWVIVAAVSALIAPKVVAPFVDTVTLPSIAVRAPRVVVPVAVVMATLVTALSVPVALVFPVPVSVMLNAPVDALTAAPNEIAPTVETVTDVPLIAPVKTVAPDEANLTVPAVETSGVFTVVAPVLLSATLITAAPVPTMAEKPGVFTLNGTVAVPISPLVVSTTVLAVRVPAPVKLPEPLVNVMLDVGTAPVRLPNEPFTVMVLVPLVISETDVAFSIDGVNTIELAEFRLNELVEFDAVTVSVDVGVVPLFAIYTDPVAFTAKLEAAIVTGVVELPTELPKDVPAVNVTVFAERTSDVADS